MNQKIHTHHYYLTAARCDAQRELAPWDLTQQIIEVATEHADILGVGFKDLQRHGTLWVLSRIAIEMKRYPTPLEHYAINTWIEGFNRHFSERNMEIVGEDGSPMGYARTIWMAIDMNTRRPANLQAMTHLASTVSDKPCPIAKQGKIRTDAEPTIHNEYTFRLSDIDFNRHVNSCRYIELIFNQLSLETMDRYYSSRLEVEYRNEAHFADMVAVDTAIDPADGSYVTTVDREADRIVTARLTLTPRQPFPSSDQ